MWSSMVTNTTPVSMMTALNGRLGERILENRRRRRNVYGFGMKWQQYVCREKVMMMMMMRCRGVKPGRALGPVLPKMERATTSRLDGSPRRLRDSSSSTPKTNLTQNSCREITKRIRTDAVSLTGSPNTVEEQALNAEEREELALQESTAAKIYGIPRSEWLALNGPARYLGNEFGAARKNWDSANIRFCLSYPEMYEVGASNLGHIILYGLLNEDEGLMCDRAYYPGEDMKAMLRRHDKLLFGVESRRPLNDFDCLGFSLSYELGATNILDMLNLSNIPLTWKERQENAGVQFNPETGSPPLIFAGGPTATSNPEPFSDFFDFFALGDGEELLPEIGRCLQKCRAEGLDREMTLFRLATTVDGVYVPQFYDSPDGFGGAVYPNKEGIPPRIRRRVCSPDPFQQIGLVPYVNTVHDRLTVEIRRGCTRGCRFCQPGMLTRPARDVEPEKVVEAVEWGMRKTGYNEFSLLSLSCSDYLSLPAVGIEIKNRLGGSNVSLSLPSQRVDAFNDDIANIISDGGKRSGLTFAPEAGTQRMRDVINKGLTNEELLRGVRTAWDKGWRQVKLYFMIGLPGETDADVLGIAETIEWLQNECSDGRWHLAVNVTISNFSPKPHTPFQWHSVSTAEFLRKQQMLKDAFNRLSQVKANFTPVSISEMEDFISRGDRRIGPIIRRAWELGATNDGWWHSSEENHKLWSQAIDECGLTWKYRQVNSGEWNVMDKIGDSRYRKQGAGGKGRIDRGEFADARLDAPLPWDHVDTGISKWWLKSDLQRALEAATVPDCAHTAICSECGVCGDEFGENIMHPPPPVPEFQGHGRPNSNRVQRVWFRYEKTGDMVFVGHLDLMSLWDRACRRAAIPITADQSPFSARTRIYTALPLALGATSSSEILELNLTEHRNPRDIMQSLRLQLPEGLNLVSVEEVDVKKADGRNGEKMSQLMRSVEYYIALKPKSIQDFNEAGKDHGECNEAVLFASSVRFAVEKLLSSSELPVERVVKAKRLRIGRSGVRRQKGKKKTKSIDIRPSILDLEAFDNGSGFGKALPPKIVCHFPKLPNESAVVKFRTSCLNGNPQVSPTLLLESLEKELKIPLIKIHLHRSDIDMAPPAPPKPDKGRLRSLIRMEGHLAAEAIFRGTGLWSNGLENRYQEDA